MTLIITSTTSTSRVHGNKKPSRIHKLSDGTIVKECYKCKVLRPLEDFYNMTKHPDGKDTYCKPCRHRVTRAYSANRTPEQKARRLRQVKDWYIKKYGVPYEPAFVRNAREEARTIAITNANANAKTP